jgi:glycosyltransferase involved in cell wall biosynthesis
MTVVGVFLNSELRTGGHARYLELMEGLARRGHRVVLLVNRRLSYEPGGVETIRVPAAYRRRSFPPASWVFSFHARAAAGLLREKAASPDAVVVFGGTHLAAGAALARRLSTRLVYGHRSNIVREELTYLSEPTGGLGERIAARARLVKSVLEERRIGRLVDLAVFQSPYDRDDFCSRVRLAPARTAVIRGDISNARFRADCANTNRSSSLVHVLFLGALNRRKGVDYLIDAVGLLRERGYHGLKFEICGPGDRSQELNDRLSRRGLSGMATIRGRVDEPFRKIAESDLLVVPSLLDSYPNTVLEALHVGTPVIGSRVGGIPDQLAYDELLFPPMDAGAIADRIERCLREPDFYRRIRDLCSIRRSTFLFDWAEAWEKAIASCGRE